jgi:mRNA interferase HicA
VKRREFVREPVAAGRYLKRHGAAHDLYFNPRTGRTVPVPRHTEIRDTLARSIRKQLGFDA